MALRKAFIVHAERRCEVELRGGVITMLVPALNARVRVDVNFNEVILPPVPQGWVRKMYDADEHAAVAVYVQRT
jgi:hypothetical protein